MKTKSKREDKTCCSQNRSRGQFSSDKTRLLLHIRPTWYVNLLTKWLLDDILNQNTSLEKCQASREHNPKRTFLTVWLRRLPCFLTFQHILVFNGYLLERLPFFFSFFFLFLYLKKIDIISILIFNRRPDNLNMDFESITKDNQTTYFTKRKGSF